jgi:hypothetical protein
MIENNILTLIIADMHNQFVNTNECFSKTRDVFMARIQSYIIESEKYLEAAIIGEIGNNTFDHNFMFLNDVPRGVYCNLSYLQKYVVIADYGKGVRKSLSAAMPSISSDTEAVETAFTKRISGRYPEQRGNGLKFVSETIRQNNWQLYFQSGYGLCSIDETGIKFSEASIQMNGCLAVLDFSEGDNYAH